MIENNISDNLYNELFTKSSEEKFMAWSLIVHKNTIKNCSTVLQVFSSQPPFTTCIFCSLFHGGKDISAIPQPSVHHLVYVSLIFFRFHKYFNNFHLNKNLLTNTFFH